MNVYQGGLTKLKLADMSLGEASGCTCCFSISTALTSIVKSIPRNIKHIPNRLGLYHHGSIYAILVGVGGGFHIIRGRVIRIVVGGIPTTYSFIKSEACPFAAGTVPPSGSNQNNQNCMAMRSMGGNKIQNSLIKDPMARKLTPYGF